MGKPYQILIVEDEARWREDILREALEDQGYRVRTSDNYTEAIAALDRHTFDLAIIDVNLTGVSGNQDGVRVLERVAALGGRTQSIMISGSKTRAMAEETVRQYQPLAFVDKTIFDVAEFVKLVTQALNPSPR